ncbi:MAG: hypothetical protein QXV32_06825 [Conexivisphaerales archaeon]
MTARRHMSKLTFLSSLSLILMLIITAVSFHPSYLAAQTITSSQVLSDIQNTFVKLSTAEHQGANVTLLANELTQAIQLVQEGQEINQTSPSLAISYYQQAEQIVQSVNGQIDQAIKTGQAEAQAEITNLSIYLGILAALGLFVYFYSGKIFWRLWLRYHSSWIAVKRRDDKKR